MIKLTCKETGVIYYIKGKDIIRFEKQPNEEVRVFYYDPVFDQSEWIDVSESIEILILDYHYL